MSRHMSEEQRQGAGCLAMLLLSALVLAASVVVGGIFGWHWGFATYFGSIGAFGLWVLGKYLRGDA